MRLGTLLVFMICVNAGTCIEEYYMDRNCGRILDFSILGLHQIRLEFTSSYGYKPNTNCVLYLRTEPYERFMLYFKSVKTSSCKHAWLDIFDSNGTTTPLPGLQKNCGTTGVTSVYTTAKGVMTLNFVSDNFIFKDKGFDMVITAFHTGSCYGDEFLCDNGRCIDNSLKCNGYNPCGDNSDYCPLSGSKSSCFPKWAIIVIGIGGPIVAILGYIAVTVLFKKYCLSRGSPKPEVTETTPINQAASA